MTSKITEIHGQQSAKKLCEAPKNLPLDLVNLIFASMNAIYLNRWASNFPSQELLNSAKEQWGLGLAGLSLEDIDKGIRWFRRESKWPPLSPADFLEACGHGKDHRGQAYQACLPEPERELTPESQAVRTKYLDMLRGLRHE